MNDYLIDPMMFYWMGIADSLITFCAMVAIIIGLTLVATIGFWIYCKLEEEKRKKCCSETYLFSALFFSFCSRAQQYLFPIKQR